jgi:AcrR family transcriptional regulator
LYLTIFYLLTIGQLFFERTKMGIAERRQREKEQRQKEIIDAAEKVFFAKGLDAATMDDVAEAAELSKGTLYLYFKSKEQLYLAVIMRGFEIMDKMFKEAVAKRSTGLEQLRAVGETYFTFYHKYQNYFKAMMYFEANDITVEEVATIQAICHVDNREHSLNILIGCLENGFKDGSIRKDVDPVKMAILLWGMSTGIFQLSHFKQELVLEQHNLNAETMLQTFFEYIEMFLKA